MGSIRIMPDALASQVAAGEVVERPASVVKELLENSLDAGASRIDVVVERGGAALLRISDDGSGMSREDALLSVERHATSKLRDKEDLNRISTYGFRGEALPSIASVSRFRLATRQADAIAGTEIIIEGGKVIDVRDCGDAPGTQIEVRSLFYNVPARRKFLRAEATEFGHIEAAVRVAALARPEVAFSLRHGKRKVFQIGASKDRLGRINELVGMQVAEQLIEVAPTEGRGGLQLEGWIARPGFTRPSRALQYIFLNGRPIDAAPLGAGLREAYTGFLERGQHPPVFLFLQAEPASVDVNVHPAKREVRFHDPRGVQQLLAGALAETLRADSAGTRSAPLETPESDEQSPASKPAEAAPAIKPELPTSTPQLFEKGADSYPKPAASGSGPGAVAAQRDVESPADSPVSPSSHRLLGTLGARYAVLEAGDGDGLVLMHRRAAHERILYEEALVALEGKAVSSQGLLAPQTITLSPEDYQVAIAELDQLTLLGIGVEDFGDNTLKVDALPVFCGEVDAGEFVGQLVADLRAGGARAGQRLKTAELAKIVSHRSARIGEASHDLELDWMLKRLLSCEMPYVDPRGRPTLVQFSHQELARKFGIRP